MSGDCPHREELKNTLLQYQQQAALLANTQTDYLHIVGELKNELDTLSCQVTDILEDSTKLKQGLQHEHNNTDNDNDLVLTLRDLEHQNDLLQAALEQAIKQRDDDCSLELVAKNAYLQSRMQTMCQTLADKDRFIQQQNIALERLATPAINCDAEALNSTRSLLIDANKRVETLETELDRCRNAEQIGLQKTRELNNELVENKKRNGELQTQLERLRLLLKDSNENYEGIQKKYELLNKTTETQTKQIFTLQQKIADLQKQITHDTMETKLLQHQVTTLKQKDACTVGELKAIQERYTKIETELIESNDMVTKLKSSITENDEVHMRNMRRQLETNTDLEKRLQKALEQFEKLQKEHDELNEICQQQNKTIESYNKWKVEQRKADAKTRESIEKYDNHLKLLTEQNMACLERCQTLHADNQYLTKEIERLKVSKLRSLTETVFKALSNYILLIFTYFVECLRYYVLGLIPSTKPGIFTPMNTNSKNLLLSRLDQLRLTTQRVLQQKIDLHSDSVGSVRVSAMDVPTASQPFTVTSDYFSRPTIPTSSTLSRTNSPYSTSQFSPTPDSSPNQRLKQSPIEPP